MKPTQAQKLVVITPPAAIVDNLPYTTAEIDTKGFDYLDVVVLLGATDIAMAALDLNMSDTVNQANPVLVATFAGALPGAGSGNTYWAFHVDLRGKRRYFDLSATAGDGATGTYLAAFAILSCAEQMPATATARGFTGERFA
jgi:hypothetical protein